MWVPKQSASEPPEELLKNAGFGDSPGGLVVRNPPVNAEDLGSNWSEKIPHVFGQLSPWATTAETVCLESMICNKRSHCIEKPLHCNEE